MTIKIIGSQKEIQRKITGLYSLDRACINDRGEIGVPIGHGYEIFGANHVGKSTFTYSLAGILAEDEIYLCDLEGFDPTFLSRVLEGVGFDGTINIINEDEDEKNLMEMIDRLKKEKGQIGILDSIGAISPLAEAEGDIGEANMGRRAMAMAQFTRKALRVFRESKTPKTLLMINHWYPNIGSRGFSSPGGEVKKYICTVRIHLKRKEEFPDGSYVLEGKIYKNRWGYKDRNFWVFVLAGRGIHKGLTAMYDLMLLGKVKRGKTIKIGDESLGYLKDFVKAAKHNENEKFQVFLDMLETLEEPEIEEPKPDENGDDEDV